MKKFKLKFIFRLLVYLLSVISLFIINSCGDEEKINSPINSVDTSWVSVIAITNIESGQSRILTYGSVPQPIPFSNKIFFSKGNGFATINTDGTDEKVLPILHSFYNYSITPDGKKIVLFLQENNTTTGLWMINKDGSGLKRLLDIEPIASIPDYSSKLDKMVFTNGNSLVTMNMDGSNYQIIKPGSDTTYYECAKFLPDNDRIVLMEEQRWEDVFSNVAKMKILSLSTREEIDLGNFLLLSDIQVSRDGKIVFTSFGNIEKEGYFYGAKYIDTNNDYKVSKIFIGGMFVSLSPDGKTIAYGNSQDIHLVNIDGTNDRIIVPQSDTTRSYFSITPDGKYIVHQAAFQKGK